MAGRLTPGTGSQIIMEAWGSYSRVQYSRCLILARGPPLHFSLGPSKGKTVWAPLLSTNVSSAGCSAANPATTGTIEADAPLIQRKHFLSSAAPQTGWDVTGRRLAWTTEHFQTSRTDGCLIKWRLPLIQLVWSPDRRRNFSFDWFCIISPNQRPVAVWINRRIVGPDYRWRWNNHKKAQYCFFFPAFKKPPPHYSQIKMARWFTSSLSPVAEPSARPHLSTHTHVCTRTHLYTRVTYVHAREQGQPVAEDSAPLWSCLLAFHFAAPQAQHTHTHSHKRSDVSYKCRHGGRICGESQFASLSFLRRINWALQNSAFDRGSQGNWLLNRDILYRRLLCERVAIAPSEKRVDRSSFYCFCSELWTLYCWEEKKKYIALFLSDYPENQLYKVHLTTYRSAAFNRLFMTW